MGYNTKALKNRIRSVNSTLHLTRAMGLVASSKMRRANESMNSGCAVVASDAIGSVPYLVKDRENGLVYHSGSVDELLEKVIWLLDRPEEQRRLGENACRTITELWNAQVAAERFIQLAQAILDGDPSPELFQEGPCSRAEVIREDWYRG